MYRYETDHDLRRTQRPSGVRGPNDRHLYPSIDLFIGRLLAVSGRHPVSQLQGRSREPQKILQRPAPQGQRPVARLGMVSDTGVQSAEPGAGPLHQTQERLGRDSVGGQQVFATQEPDRAVEVDKRKGNNNRKIPRLAVRHVTHCPTFSGRTQRYMVRNTSQTQRFHRIETAK